MVWHVRHNRALHEHIFVLQPEALQNYGHVWGASYWDEEAGVADAIEKLVSDENPRHPLTDQAIVSDGTATRRPVTTAGKMCT